MWKEGSLRDRLSSRVKKLIQLRALDTWIPELTGPVLPPRQRPLSPTERQILAQQVSNWLAQGVIEPRRKPQPINNNLVFVAKKDGTIRVCDDCTPVNTVTKSFDWPLPRLQDLRHLVQKNLWFTRLDLKSAFFRIRVPAKYRHYTAFTSEKIQYQFKRMPFGVKTGPSTFQQFMDNWLAHHGSDVVCYIDDILIGGETLGQLRQRTIAVLRTLKQAGTEINEEKSEYEKQTLLFAGIRITTDGIGPNRAKVAEILSTPLPRTKPDMQSALGLVSYLRDFIPLVAHFTALLYGGEGSLPPEEVATLWDKLLRHVASATNSLRHWDEKDAADLYADASGYGLGVVLIQKQRIVALASRKLTRAERNYSATDREHCALVYAAKKFKIFLHRPGGETRVHSDHAALIGTRNDYMTPRQTRWQTIVNQWMPNVVHVPGKDNPADFFSRWDVEIAGGVMNYK